MTSDHMKTKIDAFHKTNSQANCGMEWGVGTWSPESPDLYDITFEVVSDGKILDTVGSYFAMREIRIDGSNILLNGHPLYQRLIRGSGLLEGFSSDTAQRGGTDRGYRQDPCPGIQRPPETSED